MAGTGLSSQREQSLRKSSHGACFESTESIKCDAEAIINVSLDLRPTGTFATYRIWPVRSAQDESEPRFKLNSELERRQSPYRTFWLIFWPCEASSEKEFYIFFDHWPGPLTVALHAYDGSQVCCLLDSYWHTPGPARATQASAFS
ncbi:hypothetical protein LIA77_03938 [Sarocladium implicatum]|nr:hypothetical protein LIA77_03938 [Sarocladium implicatum]